eukprot:366423-Chlamydomonas_euryale.AAC.1
MIWSGIHSSCPAGGDGATRLPMAAWAREQGGRDTPTPLEGYRCCGWLQQRRDARARLCELARCLAGAAGAPRPWVLFKMCLAPRGGGVPGRTCTCRLWVARATLA